MCNQICDYEKCFEFDFIEDDKILNLEKNQIPRFTAKNIALINAFLKYNSSYSAAENGEDGSYSKLLSDNKEHFFEFEEPKPAKADAKKEDVDEAGNEKTILYRVIESIDRINSTHLASEGGGKKAENESLRNKGRVSTAKAIREINGLESLLKEGKPEVVYKIASAFKGKHNFSFATKFCTYVCKYIFEEHNKYCIYDNVVQSVLPIYIAYYVESEDISQYCHRKTRGKNKGDIVSDIDKYIKINDKEKDYGKYRDIIDKIIAGIQKKDGDTVTYEQFDHMLWYYFKGSETKVQKALNTINLPCEK